MKSRNPEVLICIKMFYVRLCLDYVMTFKLKGGPLSNLQKLSSDRWQFAWTITWKSSFLKKRHLHFFVNIPRSALVGLLWFMSPLGHLLSGGFSASRYLGLFFFFFFGGDCLVHYNMFSNIPGLYHLNASSIPASDIRCPSHPCPDPCTIRNVSSHCQMSQMSLGEEEPSLIDNHWFKSLCIRFRKC